MVKVLHWIYLHLQSHFFLQQDLCNTLTQSGDMGASGALFWSTSNGMTTERCKHIAEYVRQELGPYVEELKSRAELCARKSCNR